MGTEQQTELKSYHVGLFSLNYFFQGMVMSVFAVIVPIYLVDFVGVLNVDSLATIASIVLIPWAIKIFFGFITDKVKVKNFGRRKPWIIGPMCFAGILWIILGIPGLMTPINAITVFIIFGFFINAGAAFADTALDGLILDICPKEKLGRTQGLCWGLRQCGMIAGGPAAALIIVLAGMPVETIFIILGICMIVSSFTILIIKENDVSTEANIVKHLKLMFNNKKDLKTYVYSFFTGILDGIVILFVGIVILVQMGLITNLGTSLSLPAGDTNIYIYNGNISLIIGVGIIIGSIVGGRISDLKSRRLSAYLSYLVTTIALLLMIIPVGWPILLFFSSLIGFAVGHRFSAYSPIVGEYSKRHPEMTGTYFSICNSFSNFGAIAGISLTGMIFGMTLNFWSIFLFMAIISNLGLIGLMTMDTKDYESK